MEFNEILDLYELISSGAKNAPTRNELILMRKSSLNKFKGFEKLAFDTRRINQETDYIPRRGLQNYHRSESFISDSIAIKIKAFSKLAEILNELKLEFGKQPEWQDSYTRVLCSSVDKGLRTVEHDGDYSDAQPSVGSLDYLEELMYVRYRLTPDNLLNMANNELRAALLNKDEFLISRGVVSKQQIIMPSDVTKYSYDHMMDKMLSTIAQVMSSYKQQAPDDNLTNKLFDIKATPENKDIERTVTITIKDKINDVIEKKAIDPVIIKDVIIDEEFLEN